MQTVTYFQNHRSRCPSGNETKQYFSPPTLFPPLFALALFHFKNTDISRNRWLLFGIKSFCAAAFRVTRVINGLNRRYGHLDNMRPRQNNVSAIKRTKLESPGEMLKRLRVVIAFEVGELVRFWDVFWKKKCYLSSCYSTLFSNLLYNFTWKF